MVTDEDDDRAFFARNVVQCVSLAVGGRKPELRRRRIKNDLGSRCRHIAPPCAQIYADDGLRGQVSKARSRVASGQPFPVYPLTADVERSVEVGRSGPEPDFAQTRPIALASRV